MALTEELETIDNSLLQEASKIIRGLSKALDRFELTQLLSGPYDKEGAVVTITAGAGGTDAQVCIYLPFFLDYIGCLLTWNIQQLLISCLICVIC